MSKIWLFIVVFLLPVFSIWAKMKDGVYRGALLIKAAENIEIPFIYEWKTIRKKPVMIIRNADERIEVTEIEKKADSLILKLPVFDTEFRCVQTPNGLQGEWVNHYRSSMHRLPFVSTNTTTARFFDSKGISEPEVAGRWDVTFSPELSKSNKAIAVLKHLEGTDLVSGTFLTESGDYRFLEGMVKDHRLYLSAFDGSHAYLFVANITNGWLNGQFYSGLHYTENWIAQKNSEVSLRDAETITTIANPEIPLELSIKNLDDKLVSLSDEQYKNKPIIIQIMGSWCANCMDESAYFSELYKQYNKQGLEIIAVAFERTTDDQKAKAQVTRLKTKYNITYPILLPLVVGKDQSAAVFPRLNGIAAYPTTLFLNKQHQVVKIHTGFSGPATGNDYAVYKQRTENLINHLLSE